MSMPSPRSNPRPVRPTSCCWRRRSFPGARRRQVRGGHPQHLRPQRRADRRNEPQGVPRRIRIRTKTPQVMAALIPQKMFDEQLAAMDIENFAQATIRQVGAVGGASRRTRAPNSCTSKWAFRAFRRRLSASKPNSRPSPGTRFDLPQHHGHRPAQERGFALRQGVPRHRRRPEDASRPSARCRAASACSRSARSATPRKTPFCSSTRASRCSASRCASWASSTNRSTSTTSARETRSQAGELSQAGQRRGDHLLEPQQPGVDLPHRERTAHHRRVGNQVRHDRSRRLGLHGHGLPQGAGTSFPGSVPGHRSPLYG